MNNVVRTPLGELNLTDRFLFAETMDEPEAYEAVVGILLEDEIELLEHAQTEKELRISPELRAVRLDVINMDETGQIYFTEMQKRDTKNLEKRNRLQMNWSRDWSVFLRFVISQKNMPRPMTRM